MTELELVAILITLTAGLAYLNARWLRLPSAIGLMAMALLASAVVLILDGLAITEVAPRVSSLLDQVNFPEALLHGALGLLLFAGALHINLEDLRALRAPIALLAVAGTALSTALIGIATYLVLGAFGLDVELVHCLLFGALISPTDPIAVLGVLRAARVPRRLEVTITGESLFNDGVGVVLFLSILAVAGGGAISATSIVRLFLQELVGGAAFGLAIGYVGFRLLRSIDRYSVEIMITLAIVLGGYVAAERMHVSAPIAAVAAGLLIGNQGRALAMSATTREHLDLFWEMVDEILNGMLFLLIGLEVVHLRITSDLLVAAVITIPIVLAVRLGSVGALLGALPAFRRKSPGALALLTWGGVRGGISVALALSLPNSAGHDTILVSTYCVVVFSILIQGTTIGPLARRIASRPSEEGPTVTGQEAPAGSPPPA